MAKSVRRREEQTGHPGTATVRVGAGQPRMQAVTVTRTVRVGAVPVLTVTVIRPVVEIPADGGGSGTNAIGTAPQTDGVNRFNDGTRRMAETFLAYVLDEPARAAADAYRAAGNGAAYSFPRREVLCKMTINLAPGEEADATILCLRTEVTYGLRRRGAPEKSFLEESFFEYPSMTLAVREKFSRHAVGGAQGGSREKKTESGENVPTVAGTRDT